MADADKGQESGSKLAESGLGAETPGFETEAGQDSTAALQAELANTKDRLLRALAEQQNIRQQMQRQREEAVKFAASQLTGDLLDTLDNLRRAIESVPRGASDRDGVNPILKGVEATEANLLATLSRHGLQRIDPLGVAFDPHVHHAIRQHPDATVADGTVVEVLQPGYLLHGRILRPAMVGVAVNGQKDRAAATS
ncbi:nucleotide exchange factor GrpE [Rhizobium sp. CECT 9324]|uniref:nucleotide exchange factor GrpE n=1 Tax=Rhizobium sp. CECT 9324 TaxID=2845820 RepID=UPI001E5F9406|nr:nucleotide exchange factor GrpE [Rhizobium sp. CECT 9324]CAH0342579.1 Protein GrpE [Rhizobium sp. CECT 9324]